MAKNITLALPDELWSRMEKLGEVNWSAVAREAIERYVGGREGPNLTRTPEDEERLLRDQVGLLVRALRTKILSVRESAIVQLSIFGNRAVPYLKAAVSEAMKEAGQPKKSRSYDSSYSSEDEASDPEGAITGICVVLGMIGDQRAFPELKESLPRLEAVDALAKLRSEEALSTIVESIPKWYTKSRGYSGGEDSGKYGVKDDFVRRIFSHFGEDGVKHLRELLQSGNDETRERVSKIVAILGDSESIAGLQATLENGNYSAQAEAARAILDLKAKQALPTLVATIFKMREYVPSPQLVQNSKGGRSSWGNDTEYNDRESWRGTCSAIADAILELGSVDDFIAIAFHWPRIEPVEYRFRGIVLDAGEKAVPGLTRLLHATEAEIQRAAAEMIAQIKRGEKYEPRRQRV